MLTRYHFNQIKKIHEAFTSKISMIYKFNQIKKILRLLMCKIVNDIVNK